MTRIKSFETHNIKIMLLTTNNNQPFCGIVHPFWVAYLNKEFNEDIFFYANKEEITFITKKKKMKK